MVKAGDAEYAGGDEGRRCLGVALDVNGGSSRLSVDSTPPAFAGKTMADARDARRLAKPGCWVDGIPWAPDS